MSHEKIAEPVVGLDGLVWHFGGGATSGAGLGRE
jgi:hypothetical protein